MSFQSNFSSVKEKMDRAVVSPKGKRRPQLLKNSYRGEAEEENSGYVCYNIYTHFKDIFRALLLVQQHIMPHSGLRYPKRVSPLSQYDCFLKFIFSMKIQFFMKNSFCNHLFCDSCP